MAEPLSAAEVTYKAIDLVTPTMGELEPSLPPIYPSEYSFQDVVLLSDENLLEDMTSLDIPLEDAAMVVSNDHIFGLDYLATEPNPNFVFESDLTINRPLDNGEDESSDSAIELQIGVPVKYDLPMCRSLNFGLEEYSLIDSTKVMNTAEEFKVEDTCIQVTINRSIPLNHCTQSRH